jgi:hypothetical protein
MLNSYWTFIFDPFSATVCAAGDFFVELIRFHFEKNWKPLNTIEILSGTRVARFFFVHIWFQNRKNVPTEHKMYKIVIKYPKFL